MVEVGRVIDSRGPQGGGINVPYRELGEEGKQTMRLVLTLVVVVTSFVVACGGGGEPAVDVSEEPAASEQAPVEPEEPPAAEEPEEPEESAYIPDRTPPADVGDWVVTPLTNPLDDSLTILASLSSIEGVGGFDNDPIRLLARCRSNRTEVFVIWHDFLGSGPQQVTSRFPPASARTESWVISTDADTSFAPRPIPFLRQVLQSERLVLQVTPYLESPTTAVFDLTGADLALRYVAETCNWNLSG